MLTGPSPPASVATPMEGWLLFFAHDLIVCRAARQAALLGGELQSIFAVELGLANEFLDAVGQALGGIRLCSSVGGSFRADQQRDFASRGALVEGGGEFGEFAAAELFVQLRNFTRDAGSAIAKHLPGVANTLRHALRSFLDDAGA